MQKTDLNINLLKKKIRQTLGNAVVKSSKLAPLTIDELAHEVSIYHQELVFQNEELMRQTAEAKAMQNKYHALFDDAPTGNVVIDQDDKIIIANKQFGKLVQRDVAEITALSLTSLIHPASQDAFYLGARELKRTGYAEIHELYLAGSAGAVRTSCSMNSCREGGEEQVRLVFIDRTHCRTAAEARREAELKEQFDLLNLMFQQSLTGIFFIMLDEPIAWNNGTDKEKTLDYIFDHQRITKANAAMLAMYRASEEDFIGKTPHMVFQHDLSQGRQVWKQFFDAGHLHIDTDARRFDGSPMYVVGDYICLYDCEERITGYFGIQIDISDKKEAEAALRRADQVVRQEHAQLQLIIQTIPAPVVVVRLTDNTTVYCNEAFGSITGYTDAEVIGRNHLDLEIYADLTQLDRMMALLLHEGFCENFEMAYWNKAKQRIDAVVSARVLSLSGEPHVLAIARDITAEKAAARALAESEARYRMVAENMTDVIWTIDAETGRFLYLSPSVYELAGYTAEEMMTRPFEDLHTPASAALARQQIEDDLAAYAAGEPLPGRYAEFEASRKDGSTIWIGVSKRFYQNPHTGRIEIGGVTRDITARKQVELQLQQSEAKYRALLEQAGQAVMVIQDGVIKYCNPYSLQLSGYQLDEVVGHDVREFTHPQDIAVLREHDDQLLAGQVAPAPFQFRIVRKDGAIRWLEASPMVIEWEGAAAILSLDSDITCRKRQEEEIQYLSYHDQLTGLYNRRYYEETLTRFTQQEQLPLSIILGDVNGLKLTNDAFGHLAGDKLLQTIADAVKSVCRPDDVAARIGGDEFALLLPNTSAQEAEQAVQRLQAEISGRQSGLVIVSLSVGYATKTGVLEENSWIYMQADEMMYSNKLAESMAMKRATLDSIMRQLFAGSSREEQHACRVSRWSGELGLALGLDSCLVSELQTAGRLHDIGKIGINAAVLDKQESLTEMDRRDSLRHPEIGYTILSALPEYGEIARIVLAHHEHYDGSGYPKGLGGEDIPLAARIIHIVEAFDSMVNGLNHHEPWDERQAIGELRRLAGRQFDPAIVDVFAEQVLSRDNR